MSPGFQSSHRFTLPPKSKSGLKGVSFQPQLSERPWKAYIRKHGQYRCLGYFATRMEAARAYNRHALLIHGPSAYFNPLPC